MDYIVPFKVMTFKNSLHLKVLTFKTHFKLIEKIFEKEKYCLRAR